MKLNLHAPGGQSAPPPMIVRRAHLAYLNSCRLFGGGTFIVNLRAPGGGLSQSPIPVNPPGDAHKMPKTGILARRTVSAAGAQTYSKDSGLS